MEQATDAQIRYMKGLGIKFPNDINKIQAKYAIENALNNQSQEKAQATNDATTYLETIPKEKPLVKKPLNGNSSYYVSYAKDIFICLMESHKPTNIEGCKPIMVRAIELVKQAQEAFS